MNQAKKYQLVSILLAVLLLGMLAYGYAVHRGLKQELDQLQREKLESTSRWVQMQQMYAQSLDYDLANILSSNSASYRGKHLKSAYESASYMANSHWFNPSVANLSDFQVSYAEPFWRQASSYLGYLLDENPELLTEIQRQSLLKMRDFTLKTIPVMHQINKEVLYKTQLTGVPEEELRPYLVSLMSKLQSMPSIGEKEPLFNEYLYKLNPYQPNKNQRVFNEEKRVQKEDLKSKVQSFMSVIWKDNKLVETTFSGGGVTPMFGDSLRFWSNSAKQMIYEVEISVSGAHLLRIYPSEEGTMKLDNGPMTKEKAIAFAEALVSQWGEASLVFDHSVTRGSALTASFVPQVGGINHADASVEITIDTSKGILQYFDTTNYYLKKDQNGSTSAAVLPDVAREQINAGLTVTGKPKLMIRNGKLVYMFPVSGYERVTKVYVNAQTGKQVDIEYSQIAQ